MFQDNTTIRGEGLRGGEVDMVVKMGYSLSRLLITLPVYFFSIYFIVNTVLPGLNNTVFFVEFWICAIIILVTSYIEKILRLSIFPMFTKISFYPLGLLNVDGEGGGYAIQSEFTIFNKRNKIKKYVSGYFKYEGYGSNHPKFDVSDYITFDCLSFYLRYNNVFKSNKEIKSMLKDIIYGDKKAYDKYMIYGDDALVEYYTKQFMKDFRFPFASVVIGVPTLIIRKFLDFLAFKIFKE